MEISQREEAGVLVFFIEGRIDNEGAIQLENALQEALSGGFVKLVLDLGEVVYVNSAGLRTLASVLTTCRDTGGDLMLANLNSKVSRVLSIVGFDHFFNLFDDATTAVTAF